MGFVLRGGRAADIILGLHGMGQVRQKAKVAALKEKSADFKPLDLGSPVYTPINYNHRL